MIQPLITVIVPVYKVEAYLDACVESVLGQTYGNFELILVDDGSPDNCPQLCDAFAARDPRVRVIHKANGGLSSARNAGIDAARGEYLAFLDSDDLWSPLFLERLQGVLRETGADLAVCLFRRFRGDPPGDLPVAAAVEVMSQEEAFGCLFNNRNENMVVAANKLYRRRLFDTLRYPVGKLHEDEAVIHEILGGAETVAWVEESHYLYRQTPDSITTAKFSLKRLDETYAKEQRIVWFEEHGMQDFAGRTRLAYLSNLMRLYRTVQQELEDRAAAEKACRDLYKTFRGVYGKAPVEKAPLKLRLRCGLFLLFPRVYSTLEYSRMKRKETI